jgi:hypothetical protein
MRQRYNFAGRYRSHERSFSSDAQFLKFAGRRERDNPVNLVRSMPNLSTNTVLPDLFAASEQTESSCKAQKASA